MIFAGAIEFSTEQILLFTAIVFGFALVLTLLGALTAWGLSRRPMALRLGALAVWTGTVLVGDRFGAPIGLAAGWLSSAAVGLALAPRDRSLTDDQP